MSSSANLQNGQSEDDVTECIDWQLPLSFVKKRHTESIEGVNAITQTWRLKERVCTCALPCTIFTFVYFVYNVTDQRIRKHKPPSRLHHLYNPKPSQFKKPTQ